MWRLCFLHCICIVGAALNNVYFPECVNSSSLVYGAQGLLSITDSFIVCLKNVVDPYLFPGYDIPAPLYVQTQVALNNLIMIDELQNLVQFDMFFRVYWYDPRFVATALWDAINSTANNDGINIEQFLGPVQTLSGYQPGFWKPDIIFPDAVASKTTDEFLKLWPGGKMDWSRHIVISLIQSNFRYRDFPADTQTIVLRYNSNSLTNEQFIMESKNPGVVLYTSYQNTYSFTMNPIWMFDSMVQYETVEDNGTPGSPRLRSVTVVEATVSRQPSGMQLRLAMPVLLLVLLAALAFWGDPVDRMNTTVTVLLAVSALYIIVFQNIPMIGYLTMFDLYVIFMFFVLFGSCILHQFIIRMTRLEKISRWPLRNFYVRLFEFIGRLVIVPLVTASFLHFFYSSVSWAGAVCIYTFITLFSVGVGLRELFALYHALTAAMKEIATKFDNLDDLSMAELVLFNYTTYRIFSWTPNRHMHALRERQQRREDEAAVSSKHRSYGDIQDIVLTPLDDMTEAVVIEKENINNRPTAPVVRAKITVTATGGGANRGVTGDGSSKHSKPGIADRPQVQLNTILSADDSDAESDESLDDFDNKNNNYNGNSRNNNSNSTSNNNNSFRRTGDSTATESSERFCQSASSRESNTAHPHYKL